MITNELIGGRCYWTTKPHAGSRDYPVSVPWKGRLAIDCHGPDFVLRLVDDAGREATVSAGDLYACRVDATAAYRKVCEYTGLWKNVADELWMMVYEPHTSENNLT